MLPSKLCNLAVMALAILVGSAVRTQAADKEIQSANDKKAPGNQLAAFDRHQLQASADYAYGGVPRIFSRPPNIGRQVDVMIIPAPQDYYWPLQEVMYSSAPQDGYRWGAYRKVEGHTKCIPIERLYGLQGPGLGLIPFWPPW
jgi:hypothetical protein